MNIITAIMLIFAAIGFFDKMIGGRMGLMESFDKGLLTMGAVTIPMLGVSCVGVAFIQHNLDAVMKVADILPFDISLFSGLLLAPDMGGYFVAQQLTDDEIMVVFSSLILGSLIGQTITFQLPLFLSLLGKDDQTICFRGFTVGIIMIPVGFLAAGLLLHMGLTELLLQFIPVFIICLLMALGLAKRPVTVVKGFSVFAQGIQTILYIAFFITVMGLFIPAWAYAGLESVYEALTIVFKCVIIICGSLVMSELVLRYFRKYLQKLAALLKVNEVSVVGLLLGCATSMAMLPLFTRMDEKGKLMNAAFSVSGAYVIGGQMGFVANVSSGYQVVVFMVAKLLCGVLSMVIMGKIYERSQAGKRSEAAGEEAK